MRDIPQWILKTLKEEKLICHKCKDIMGSSHIRACGIRNSFKNKSKEVLFLEMNCNKCDELTIYEIERMSLFEFSYEIIEEMERQSEEEHAEGQMKKKLADDMNENKMESDLFENVDDDISQKEQKPNRPRKNKKSKITNKEIKDIVNFLQNSGKERFHEDFLVELGMSPEEIDSYKVKKNDK